jgi:hypothetical protein
MNKLISLLLAPMTVFTLALGPMKRDRGSGSDPAPPVWARSEPEGAVTPGGERPRVAPRAPRRAEYLAGELQIDPSTVGTAEEQGYTMLFRSTGLGKRQLTGHITGLQRQGDYIILHVDVVEPVKWHIRAALAHNDVRVMGGKLASRSIIKFVLSPRQWRNKKPKHPGEF